VTLTEWAAVSSAVAGVSATIFILLQLRHMEKHRNLEISMKLFSGQRMTDFIELLDGLKRNSSLRITRNSRPKKIQVST
jgi:hypothetical protein